MTTTNWSDRSSFSVVGARRPRVDARQKVTGQSRDSSDVHPTGMLYARVLRSPFPHARIRSINASKASALPGVRGVIHHGNTPDIEWYKDGHVFEQVVRFVGDEVAAVAADTEDIAEDALRLIEVDYEPLPFAADLDAAMASDAPEVRPGGNFTEPEVYERGEPRAQLEQADVVIDGTYTTAAALHNALESHGGLASWEGDVLTLWDSTQAVFTVRAQVADALGLSLDRVRVVMDHMGGGFGAKQVAWKHSVLAALLSREAGRPVRLVLDRHAENLAAGNRNPTRQRVRLGARRDGTLIAIDVRIEAQVGAYEAGGESSDIAGAFQSVYRCDHVRTEQVGVFTNTGPAVAFRAPGHVEAAFALECSMDELARALQMDPVELRLKNYATRLQTADLPYSTPDSLRLCYERATEAFRPSEASPASGPSKRRGRGFAAHDWSGGGSPPAYAWIKLNPDGRVDLVTGTQDLGTGTRTGLAVIAAEELGLRVEDVHVHLGDTALGPYAPTSNGSKTLASVGPAVHSAARHVREQLLEEASSFVEERPDDLELSEGWIVKRGVPSDRVMSVADLTGRIAPKMLQGFGERGPNADGMAVRTFGAHFVELEVDTSTGQIDVLRVAASHDCGRILNPVTVESQVSGGIVQGLGYALMEERVLDPRAGVVLNANIEDYHVPTVADAPVVTHAHLDVPDPYANELGAKGIGEPPLVPTAPAIANAVYDALGARIRDLPITPARVLQALAERDEGADRPSGAAT